VAIDYFKSDERFGEIILLGHSQGSLVAMLACNDAVDKYISLAGVGEPIDRTIVRQITTQNTELGKITEAHFKELKDTGGIANVNPMLLSVFAPANLDFLLSYMKFDPVEEIKKLQLPVLVINGDQDMQVSIEDAQKLHSAKDNSEIAIIKNMNHVLKHIEKESDNQTSYFSGDFPISSELIEALVRFIRK
jgi:pimeloyl-ACP methyl ester carboxylesterase